MVGRIIPLPPPRQRHVHVFIAGAREHVTLHGKGRGLRLVDESKVAHQLTLRWGDYPVLSRWPDVVTRALINEGGRQESSCENDAV